MGHTHKIAISMDGELLQNIDSAAKRRNVSRSRFIRDAIEKALKKERNQEITDILNGVFAQPAALAEQRRIAEEMITASPLSGENEEW